MRKKSLIIDIVCIVIVLGLMVISLKFKVHYLLTGSIMVLTAMLPLFVGFENKRPGARELVVIAIMSALTIASRLIFMATPMVKPVIAFIMIAGFAFGSSTGFMVGALSALVSNFFFSQGPWTLWQMLGWGVAGIIAGLLSKAHLIDGTKRIPAAILGFVITLVIVGPILDTSSVFWMISNPTLKKVIPLYLAGVVPNLSMAISTAVTLFILSGPILKKLARVKIKYGINF